MAIEHVAYGVEHTKTGFGRLYADVPAAVYQRMRHNDNMALAINQLQRKNARALLIERRYDDVRFVINDKRIGTSNLKPGILANVIRVIGGIESLSPGQGDPCLQPVFGVGLADTYKTAFDMLWPGDQAERLEALATEAMRSVAGKLRYRHPLSIDNAVYADIDLQHRSILLQTDDLSRSRWNTEGDARSPRVQVEVSNARTRDQQLIGFAGAIVISHPDMLAQG